MYMLSEARQVNKMAREVFSQDGHHRPLMLLFPPGRHGAEVVDLAPFMVNEQGKNYISAVVRKMALEQRITGVAMITEAWMAEMGKDDKETMEKIKKGEKSVSDVETKKEVLMVKAESDDGLDVVFMNEIRRDEAGNPTLMEAKEVRGVSGRLGGFFAPVLPDNSRN